MPFTELTYPTVFMIGSVPADRGGVPGYLAFRRDYRRRTAARRVAYCGCGVYVLMAIPVMFGASLLKILRFGFAFTSTELMILGIGTITAFVSSLLIIRFLDELCQEARF